MTEPIMTARQDVVGHRDTPKPLWFCWLITFCSDRKKVGHLADTRPLLSFHRSCPVITANLLGPRFLKKQSRHNFYQGQPVTESRTKTTHSKRYSKYPGICINICGHVCKYCNSVCITQLTALIYC